MHVHAHVYVYTDLAITCQPVWLMVHSDEGSPEQYHELQIQYSRSHHHREELFELETVLPTLYHNISNIYVYIYCIHACVLYILKGVNVM